jgi:ER membrane protein complex subunit 1
MRLQVVVWLLTVLLHTTSAIFSDDAFVVDYHHALVGTPQSHATLFHKPQSSSNASLIYTISDKHVLAAINPKDGTVLWRQVLESELKYEHSYLAVGERDGQIVSGYGTTISSWDALDGKLRWQYDVEAGAVVKGLQLVPTADSINTEAQDVVAVAGGDSGPSVVRLAGDGSGRRWIHQDSSSKGDSEVSVAATTDSIFYIVKSTGILVGEKATIAHLDPSTGKEKTHYSETIDSDSLVGGAQLVAGSCTGAPFVVSAEKPYKTLRFNLLGSSKQTSLTLEEKAGDILSLKVLTPCGEQAPPHFLVHAQTGAKQWAEIYHIDSKTGEAKRAYSLPATAESSAFALQSSGSDAYVVRTTDTEITLYSSSSHGELGRWKRQVAAPSASSSIGPKFVAAEVVSGVKGYAVRVAEIREDGSLSLLRNGESQWSRPEQLAYATLGAWIDASSQSALIDELETEAYASPVTAYTHRLRRHFQDLQNLPQFITGLVKSLVAAPTAGVTDVRRRLVGEKTVVLATTKNELIAVDASSAGSVTWQTDLKPHVPASVVFVHLTASDGKITVYLSDGSLAVVDAATGVFIEFLQGTVPASGIVEVPSSGAPVIAKVDANGKPHLASDFAPAVGTEGNTVVTLSEAGSAFGWTVGKDVRRTWTLQARNGEKFVSAVSRPHKDAVASVGKVLGDRSVLYKYVSPNLAVLTSASATTFSLYLIDAVTGSTLYTTSHSGGFNGASPSVVLSENWFAYAFSSQDPDTLALNTQLIIAELYESANPNDRGALAAQTNYSSYSPSAGTLPHVITQSFTVSEPLTHLAVTQTSQGITTRQLVAVLANSNGIASIPREILNARRPVDRDPTNNEKEEGLFRYNPILELEPRNLLSHSREVLGVKEIITSDSLLESTSLVFAYGHDVFGTSVTPSGAFDILGKGFNKIQLLLTIVALFGGVSLVRPLVTKKKVEAGWKA